jgi:5-formyltetrahydrofolate cyclo-ligase
MMDPIDQSSLPIPGVSEQKRQLRRSCRETRKELGEAARQQASLAICGWIESWAVFQHSDVVLAYMSMPGEVDLTPLMEHQPQKHWVLPRIIPEDNHRMVFHPYVEGRLVRHPFGMNEPSSDLPVIPPSNVQLALVPGIAFDRFGMRLGYGGGYFDRFLREFHSVSLGVIFQALLFDAIPCGEYDVPVDWIVTEVGIFRPESGELRKAV